MLIQQCQRCGQDHDINFQPLSNPANEFTLWGLCPITQEPVLQAYTPTGPTLLDQTLGRLRQSLTPAPQQWHSHQLHRESVERYVRSRDEAQRLSDVTQELLNGLDRPNSPFRQTTLYTDLLALRQTLHVTLDELNTTTHDIALHVAANELVASLSGGSPS